MEFYAIAYERNQYILVEEGEGTPAELSTEQLAIIADRLSSCYLGIEPVELRIRTYVTMYYTNDTMEYVSLSASPGRLINENRLAIKFNQDVAIDGFATTFLEGDEENQIGRAHV